MLDLKFIPPNELSKVWEIIKPGVEEVRKHGAGWLAEDVYASIKTGHSYLHIGYEEDKYIGFVVTENTVVSRGTVINVWCGYSEGNEFEFLEQCTEIFKEWTKSINAYGVRYISPRTGWVKVAPKLGFKYVGSIYELEV